MTTKESSQFVKPNQPDNQLPNIQPLQTEPQAPGDDKGK